MIELLAASGLGSIGTNIPILTLIIVVPVLGALITGVMNQKSEAMIRRVGAVAAFGTAILTILLLVSFQSHDGNYQFVTQHKWLPEFGISWKLGVDGVSLFLIVLTGVIFPIALYGAKIGRDIKGYITWMLLLEAGCLGSFMALDLFVFFVFFEVVLVPMYFLITGWGFANRNYAALKFFLYTLAGSATLFIGILALVYISASNTHTSPTFDFVTLQQQGAFSNTEARWLFIAFAIAFAVKVPIFPFHTWLGDTYEQSPIGGVVISAAVMVKLGTYGLVRFGVELFPKAAHDMAPLMLTLAVGGMIYGATIAIVQKDLKRLAAYSSLSHLGFIVMGTFAFTSLGLTGAILQMVNHGITAAAMFLLIGFIYARRQTSFIEDLRGFQGPAPVMAAAMTVVVMSSAGVPGFNGFVGEFLILLGTFLSHRWWAVVGTATVVLAALYMLWAYQRVFHGEPDPSKPKIVDLNTRERIVMAPLMVLIIFLGVYPQPVIDRIQPSVDRILAKAPIDHGVPDAPTPAPAPAAANAEEEGR